MVGQARLMTADSLQTKKRVKEVINEPDSHKFIMDPLLFDNLSN